MTEAAGKRKKPAVTPALSAAADENIARFVIDEQGHIVYASTAFAALVNLAPEKIKDQPLSAVLEFANPDSALRAQALFGRRAGTYIDALNEGVHKVLLFGHAEPLTMKMRFDIIAARDGKRYAVSSEID